MVGIFKTNIQSYPNAELMSKKLEEYFPIHQIKFDLQEDNLILRIEGDFIFTELVKGIFKREGFECEILKFYNELSFCQPQ